MPHLTSLYHFHRAGEYGDRSWPGNCGGNLIKDLLNYFQPEGMVFDPMSGQRHLPRRVRRTRHPLHVLGHPPGIRRLRPARISRSSGDVRFHLGTSAVLAAEALRRRSPRPVAITRRSSISCGDTASSSATVPGALKPGGKLAILMGDYSDREAGFVPLTYHTKRLAFAAGLRQHCTDIIRFSHGASSGKKVYRSSFIPGLHDVCMIFEKAN